jgi:hypothetical protein
MSRRSLRPLVVLNLRFDIMEIVLQHDGVDAAGKREMARFSLSGRNWLVS